MFVCTVSPTCSEMRSLKAQQGGCFSTGPVHTHAERKHLLHFSTADGSQTTNKVCIAREKSFQCFYKSMTYQQQKPYIKSKSCTETEKAYLIGSVYLGGSPSSILHIVFFHLGTNFWTGSNVACRLDRKGEAAKKGRMSWSRKVIKGATVKLGIRHKLTYFDYLLLKKLVCEKKQTGKRREEQCVK